MGGPDADATLPSGNVSAGGSAFAIGTQAAGRYRVERFVASGAMGEVYAAEDLVVGGLVALKVLRRELEGSTQAIERLRREIALARKVTNPHICRLHDVGEHDGRVFLTMELLEGETLAEHVKRRGPLPLDEIERLAAQLVDGLAALHRAGIVHRDFKTANVMLVGDRAVITDFGLARSVAGTDDARLTAEASLLGTPAYMAPEQVEARPATPASDIYALGIVVFELVTGQLPFAEDTAMATATARLHKDPASPSSLRSGIPGRWDAIVARCLARDPEARFARVEDVLGAKPRRRVAIYAIGGAVVLATAGGVLALGDRQDTTVVTASRDCPSAASKLVGVWDPGTRLRASSRFLAKRRGYITDTWNGHARQFDEHAAAWAPAWDAACAADRSADPMLWGQRIVCLEESLSSLRGYVESVGDPKLDVEEFVAGSPAEFPIKHPTQCTDTAELRAQPPPPPVANRAEVAALTKESNDLRSKLRAESFGVRLVSDLDAVRKRLDEIERRCLELDAPAVAAEIKYWRLMFTAMGPETDKQIAALIELAERTRNDAMVVSAINLDIRRRLFRQPTYDHAAAEAALERASQIADRLGNPRSVQIEIAEARLAHARRARRYDEAVRAEREFIAGYGPLTPNGVGLRMELVTFRNYHDDIDVDEAKAAVRDREAVVGSANGVLAFDLVSVAETLERAGDREAAHATAQRAAAIANGARGDRYQRVFVFEIHRDAFVYAYLARHHDRAEHHLREALAHREPDASELATHAYLADEMRKRGEIQIAHYLVERASTANGSAEDAAKLTAVRAQLQLASGEPFDGTWGERLAALPEQQRHARLALIEARSGRARSAMTHVEALTDPRQQTLVHARVAMMTGRPQHAASLLDALIQSAHNPMQIGDVHALLGLARLDAGDAAGAVAPLETARWDLGTRSVEACDARFGLARALATTSGDGERARKLATTARDRFAMMGLANKVNAIDVWLAARAR